MINMTIKNRIKIAIAAYAYEIENNPFMNDKAYDDLSKKVADNVHEKTGHEQLDKFFATEFTSNSGMWIHNHPELLKVRFIYEQYYSSGAYDRLNNDNLFAPILKRPKPNCRPCKVCGNDTLKNPLYGGCYC